MPVRTILFALIATAGIALPGNLCGQEEDEDALPPGLIGRYTAAGKTVERVDPDIAFVWDRHAPDSQLASGAFQAEWRGKLLVQIETRYVFHAFVDGQVSIRVNGKQVAAGKTDKPGWISGDPVSLEFGEKDFQVDYTRTGTDARVQIFWSSDRFPVEPVPAHLFFHEKTATDFAQIDKGRREFEGFRCGRCHSEGHDTTDMPAPSLTSVGSSLSREFLIAKIRHADPGAKSARMPDFGFSEQEATAIAEFLIANSVETKLDAGPPADKLATESRRGEQVVRTMGCLACHQIDQLGTNGPYSGGDLTNVGAKRSSAWLATWLKQPERLNIDHRMPAFELKEKELVQLTAYLSRLGNDPKKQKAAVPAERNSGSTKDSQLDGAKLVAAARCATCHRLPEKSGEPAARPKVLNASSDWSKSCIELPPDGKLMRPRFSNVDTAAVRAHVTASSGVTLSGSPFALGARLFERRNCISCHRRDGRGGLEATAGQVVGADATLQGQSETLVPPILNAVGDKLTDAALAKAVRGEQKARMNWLRVRMPRFRHSPDDQAALTSYFIGHDRIPEGAPKHPLADVAKNEPAAGAAASESEMLLAGHTIVGAQGWNCLACHQAGRFVPKNVAPATRGSDLLTFGSRMRPEFFLRWTRSPIRVAPGIEMPAYERPVPGVLDGRIDAQFAALWSALNNPQFTVPTNPTAVEQFFTVKKGEPARIVHDVFTNSKSKGGGNISRALGIGLSNGHNVVYDLATFTVRQWSVGDFARQRTEGKSWFWDLAGLPVATDFPAKPEIVLFNSDRGLKGRFTPTMANGTCGRLIEYRKDGLGVRIRYELNFEIDGHTTTVLINERIQPVTDQASKRSGWERVIEFGSAPPGFRGIVEYGEFKPLLGEPAIDSTEIRITGNVLSFVGRYLCAKVDAPSPPADAPAIPVPEPEPVTTVPGFDGVRLPFARSIMPTSLTFTAEGDPAFSTLKGHVYIARDSNGDGLPDRLDLFEEGLASAYGLISDGHDLIVSHKPELLRLSDTDGDGRADARTVVASGWGMTDNYHDWTCGIVRDSVGNYYVGLGSDYTQGKRKKEESLWRGKVLRVRPDGAVEPLGHAFRYPTGLAIDDHDRVFVTDQQGEQNCFNEINFLIPGAHYGVPARHEEEPNAPETRPAIAIPHPWTRSVNGIVFLPKTPAWGPFAGHGIGCEYDSRFLVRFTVQTIGDTVQGAVYHFSRPDAGAGSDNFRGPLCVAANATGDLYIGSIHDSGWLGGQNVGDIVRLRANKSLPNGIRELRATHDGFEIDFLAAVDPAAASEPKSYSIAGYTRVWKGGYATPDSGRYRATVKSATVSSDGNGVKLVTDALKEGFVYEVTAGRINVDAKKALFPATGHYTMLRVPKP